MHYHFVAGPMRDTTDKLLDIEINARSTSDTVHPLHPGFIISTRDSGQERGLMLEQIRLIVEKRGWFRHNSLIYALNLTDEMALLTIGDPAIKPVLRALPFIALELSERFLLNTICLNNLLVNSFCDDPNALWLSDPGSDSVGVNPLVCGHFDVVKLDRGFSLEQVGKPMFPVLIRNIREYCNRVVVKGVKTVRLIDEASIAGVWAVQGGALYPSIAFTEVNTLLLPTLCH